MKTWSLFLIEKEGEFHYSCVMADFPNSIATQIRKWGKNLIEKDDLYTKEAEGGLETEIHVTVLYGLHDTKPNQVVSLLKGHSPIRLKLGAVSIFETNPEYDVVKLSVESEDLKKLNRLLRKECKYTSDFPKYIPHCTIAYVKKGRGKKYAGNKKFAGTSVTVRELEFSSKNGKKTKIKL